MRFVAPPGSRGWISSARAASLMVVSCFLFLAFGPPLAAWQEQAPSVQDAIRLTLEAPADLEVASDERGYDVIRLPGYDSVGAPGKPSLPTAVYDVALPPDADWASLEVRVLGAEIRDVPGTFEVAPAPPAAAWQDGVQFLDWGEEAGLIVGDKDLSVYHDDAYYPSRQVGLAGLSQMRKWRFARLWYAPVQFNPVTGQLRLATRVEVELTFRRDPILADENLLADTAMEDRARDAFLNYETARNWYVAEPSMAGPQQLYDYVIITTNAIESNSLKLSSFVTHKQGQGFGVLVITEDEYGGLVGQSPNGTAEKIRKWLQDNYVAYGIEYVLLIGNPDPDDPSLGGDSVGDVPMKMCWPRLGAVSDPEYDESPTDYFYADLTGNWNLDGDTYFGEYNGDRGIGGVDWSNEVYVGRIPVYGAAYATLDAILQKIMDYETESGDLGWRKSALLPMAFSDASTDAAYLGQAMKNDYLSPNGYSAYTLYQHKTIGCNSAFASDQDLVDGAVESRWSAHDYGLVTWWGHGSNTGAYVGYGGTCEDGLILANSDCPSLDDDHPAFVYQCSCNNGYPEWSTNLGYALLKNGAVATVAASRVSWYAIGSWDTGQWPYADNASIGYYYDQHLVVDEEAAGEALFHVKSWMGPSSSWGGASWMNLMDFNLYGDPSTKLLAVSLPPDSPSDLTATAVSPSWIHLAWSDNSTSESGFKVERSPHSPGSWVEIDTVGPDVTTYLDTGLSSNTTYYYRVRAWNASGDSDYSNEAHDRTFSSGTHSWAYLPLVMYGYGVTGGGIDNGDFEAGPTAWTEYSTHGWPLIMNSGFPGYFAPHGGSWAVWLGGGNNETAYVQQQVTIPATMPYLHYWHWIDSEDTWCGNDLASVRVDNTPLEVYNLCVSTNTGGWVEHVVDLGPYADQSVSLQIRVQTSGWWESSLFVDDVSLQASASSRAGSPGATRADPVGPRSGGSQ